MVTQLVAKVLLVLVVVAHTASGFCTPPQAAATVGWIGRGSYSNVVLQSKKNPQGPPITVQADEDMAMWVEKPDQKALKTLVGGRPIISHQGHVKKTRTSQEEEPTRRDGSNSNTHTHTQNLSAPSGDNNKKLKICLIT